MPMCTPRNPRRYVPARVLLVLAPLLLTSPLPSQDDSGEPFVVVSAASYAPLVAPDSLASIFGLDLSSETLSAAPGDSGLLPTELGGVVVEVGGERAQLLFVSPGQINFLVPDSVEIGPAEVLVRTLATESPMRAEVEVARVAPALFSIPSSNGGTRAAVLNAVTFEPEPFGAKTTGPGGSSQTHLALFGTGFRSALPGSPEPSPGTESFAVEMWSPVGSHWTPAVEYVGPAPGFPGLDQVNFLLPADAAGIGEVWVNLQVSGLRSNSVIFRIRQSDPPSIEELHPAASSPGGLVTLKGIGLSPLDNTSDAHAPKVLLLVPDGIPVEIGPLYADHLTLQFILPPIPLRGSEAWYEGKAQVCVAVDGLQQCSADALLITPRLMSSQPVGDVLLSYAQTIFEDAVVALRANGEAEIAESVKAQGDFALVRLTEVVNDLRQGSTSASTSTPTEPGEPSADLTALQTIESLIIAYEQSASTLREDPKYSSRLYRDAVLQSSCVGSPGERSRLLAKGLHSATESAIQALAIFSLGTSVVVAIAAAILTGGASLPASVGLATTVFTLTSMPFVNQAIRLDYDSANYLQSLTIHPSPSRVGTGESKDLLIVGGFSARSPETRQARIYSDYASVVLSVFGSLSSAPAVKQLLVEAIAAGWTFWGGGFVPDPLSREVVQVQLGSASVRAPPPQPEARATLSCNPLEEPNVLHGQIPTTGDGIFLDFWANTEGQFLTTVNPWPFRARLPVIVENLVTLGACPSKRWA